MHHVLDALLDFGEGHGLGAIVEHAHDGVHAAEHLGQHLVLVGQHKAREPRLGQGMEALVGWHLLSTWLLQASLILWSAGFPSILLCTCFQLLEPCPQLLCPLQARLELR